MSRSQLRRGSAPALAGSDVGATVLHVDMDAFYAGVEVRRRPELAGLPMIVGGGGPRSVVLSATYEARAFGVHSAMPMMRARRLCPQAIVVEPDHRRYAAASAAVMALLRSIVPVVEQISLDEAFLDVSGAIRRLGSPRQIAELLRARVYDEQRLTASVGVASTKFVAKLASTQAKPDGLIVVPTARVIEFLHQLPTSALWGVGEQTEQTLARLGLHTIGDLAQVPESTLRRALGAAAGAHLAALAWGRDPRPVIPDEPERSIGAEETFPVDVDDAALVHRELLRLAERSAARLRAGGVVGRTVSIKVRFSDFTTITRSRTLPDPTDVARDIYLLACQLFDALGLQRARIRLVGVRVEGLLPAAQATRQLALDARELGWREAERAVDRAAHRFGAGAVRPATLVNSAENSARGNPLPQRAADSYP